MYEPLAIAFANTRPSQRRDLISTITAFRDWTRPWPVLAQLSQRVQPDALGELQSMRDAVQAVLQAVAMGQPPSADELQRSSRPGLAAAPFSVIVRGHQVRISSNNAEASECLVSLLSRALVDLLTGPQLGQLRHCAGGNCLRVFVTHRPERRWCDSRVCGNRSRVASYARRHHES